MPTPPTCSYRVCMIRSDLSCTSSSTTPRIMTGRPAHPNRRRALHFKLKPGEAIVYPSDTLHEVVPVTKGERLVAITFIQSRVPDPFKRHMLFESERGRGARRPSNEAGEFQSALMQLVQANLLRVVG